MYSKFVLSIKTKMVKLVGRMAGCYFKLYIHTYIPKEEDADSSFRAGFPGTSSRMDSSRIPAGDLVTVGGGPPLLLSSIVL